MGATLRDSVGMYAHTMHPQANAANQDDHEKRQAWVFYFYAWFSLVRPISIGTGLSSRNPSGPRSSALIEERRVERTFSI